MGNSNTAEAQDSWGWTDPQDGDEYAIVALDNGTAFVRISDPANPKYLGWLESHTGSSYWRDVKVYNNHAYIVSDDNGDHGMQIFDLRRLRNLDGSTTVTFNKNPKSGNNPNGVDGRVRWGSTNSPASAHNVIINEETGFAYVMGLNSNHYNGGIVIFNLNANLKNPPIVGSYSNAGYCHDAQVVLYNGPDPDHQGKELIIGSFSGSDWVRILDATNKGSITQISRIGYSNKQYTHQGWFTEDKRFFIVGDELDESAVGFNTRTLAFDLQDLDNPSLHYTYYGTTKATDHNGYVRGNRYYLANYTAGMRIIKIDGLYNATPSMNEVDFFDTYPPNNNAGTRDLWNIYPFFESGNLIATGFGHEGNSEDGGLFILIDPNYDNIAPAVACKNITVSLDHLGNPVSITAADIDDNSTDNFGITSLTIDKDTFTVDDIGDNTVTLTAEDDYGNIASCTATVTVTDYIPVNFTYDNNSWSPNAPFNAGNPSNFKDIIQVLSGTGFITSNTISKTVEISPGATLSIANSTLEVAGDIVNQGSITTNNGTLELIGTANQAVDGAALEIENLTLSGSATVTLNAPVSISNVLQVDNGTLQTNDQLTFKSTYNGSIHKTGVLGPVTGTIIGKVVTERFIPARRAYRLLSSPVTTTTNIRQNWQENGNNSPGFGTHITGPGGASNGFDVSGSNNPSLFKVNTATQQYEAVPYTNADATLEAGEAFLIFVRGDRTIDLQSNASPATNTVLRTNGNVHIGNFPLPAMSNTANGSTLLGNPYQAPVNMEQVLAGANNVNPRYFHVYDPTIGTRGAFVTVDAQTNTNSLLGGGASGSSANRFLQPGQAAFVNTVTNGSASLTVSENHKDVTAVSTNVFSPIPLLGQQEGRISLKLFEGFSVTPEQKALDGAQIYMGPGENSGYDVNDAFKSTNFDENLSISVENNAVSIDRRELPIDEEIIPLQMSGYRGTEYTLSIEGDQIHSHFQAYFYDSFLNEATPIENTGTTLIPFTVETTDGSAASDRFSIQFDRILKISEANLAQFITVAPNPVKTVLQIESPQAKMERIEVFDIRGRRMAQDLKEATYSHQLNLSSLETAVYFVTITTEFGKATKKIIKE
jgi:choice-of-anchor B domain-containing protein